MIVKVLGVEVNNCKVRDDGVIERANPNWKKRGVHLRKDRNPILKIRNRSLRLLVFLTQVLEEEGQRASKIQRPILAEAISKRLNMSYSNACSYARTLKLIEMYIG